MPRHLAVLSLIALLPSLAAAEDPLRESLNKGIAFLDRRLAADPDDFVAANQLADRLLRRAAWTGSLDDLRHAERIAAGSLKAMPEEQNPGGLASLARAAIGMHRFAEARQFAERLLKVQPTKSAPNMIRGDACMELGDLAAAAAAFDQAIKKDGANVATEARLGRLDLLRGNYEGATEHLEGALNLAREDADAAPDTLVWCLIQRGELAFKRGAWPEAEKTYAEARKLAPAHWSALDHLAELRAAQGKDAEAVDLFTQAAKAGDRAEIWQALGDCHAFFKRAAEAEAAFKLALAGYQASIERGEVLYIHHLAGFYSDSQENAAEAVKWARKDLEIRQTGAAHDALAWALYKQGDLPAALDESRRALQTGLIDSHVLYHAAMIHISSGDVAEGQKLLRKCAEVNPHFQSFHVHR